MFLLHQCIKKISFHSVVSTSKDIGQDTHYSEMGGRWRPRAEIDDQEMRKTFEDCMLEETLICIES